LGRIDVVLRRGKRAVACEISVSNMDQKEAENVVKCLKAGFKDIVVVSPDDAKLARIQKKVLKLISADDQKLVIYCTPETLLTRLEVWANEDPSGAETERMKPRKRIITLGAKPLSDAERIENQETMLKKLADVMKRKKPDKHDEDTSE
jgi:hypothetical protein